MSVNDSVANLALIRRKVVPVKSLSGFKKQHKVPDSINQRSERFLAELCSDTLNEDLNLVFKKLRSEFALKRAEMNVSIEDGLGCISTPDFQYSLAIQLDPDSPEDSIWTWQVAAIQNRIQVLSDAFSNTFMELFDTVEFVPELPLQVGDIIDQIEDLEDDRIQLDYDIQATSCRISFASIHGQAEIHPDLIRFNAKCATARELIEAFLQMEQQMQILRLELH